MPCLLCKWTRRRDSGKTHMVLSRVYPNYSSDDDLKSRKASLTAPWVYEHCGIQTTNYSLAPMPSRESTPRSTLSLAYVSLDLDTVSSSIYKGLPTELAIIPMIVSVHQLSLRLGSLIQTGTELRRSLTSGKPEDH